MKSVALSLFLSSGCAAFSSLAFGHGKSNTALHVSAVRDIINKKASAPSGDNDAKVLEAFERQTPESAGVRGPGIKLQSNKEYTKRSRPNSNRRRRKHNYRERSQLREEPDLDFLTLHSSAVSHLHKDMAINDIVRAIKRAQNLHDIHDLTTIGAFLMEHCDEHWGFGYRGSLLSRLAVAALHCKEIDIASRAIETRRIYERPSMEPHESAAIVRGLMRVGMVEEGWEVLEDELRLPMQGLSLKAETSQEMVRERAHALSSIATRHFYQGEPYVAARALSELGILGEIIESDVDELNMPWEKLVTAASVCNDIVARNGWDVKHVDVQFELPPDLSDLVWDTMYRFPCPGDEEECSFEDYLVAAP